MVLSINDPPSMEKDRDYMAVRILDLTLEIISLITGEDYTVVKKSSGECVTPRVSGGWSRTQNPITVPPPHSLIHEQKILELTTRITELLSGEVPIRCQDVTVYFSMEEWKYLEDHKDLYKNVMMENHQPLTSPDESRQRNPPERCPSPQYSQDCPQEKQNVPLDHHVDEAEEISGEMTSGLEDPVSESVKGEDETRDSHEHLLLSEKVEDNNVTQANSINANVPLDLHSVDLSTNTVGHKYLLSNQSLSQSQNQSKQSVHEIIDRDKRPLSGSECEKYVSQKSKLMERQRIHTREKPFSCSECGKCFGLKSSLVKHRRIHTGEKPFSCSECGKHFSRKWGLVEHVTFHKGEKPFSCPECGKCFAKKSHVVEHLRTHTGEKPFPCLECGKCFSKKSNLVEHLRTHTGEKPFLCSECGKCFGKRSVLVMHKRSHIGEKPYSCPDCGKCFSLKSCLVTHQRTHTGEKPFSCPDCRKCFGQKSTLVTHQRTHSKKKPFSCSECGTCFSY
ncbi:oocyte zinc finger protein XlCOF8.4-like isoform X2 [Bufo gargarizans]|uniref:oocyte zinc finger protein XlCOF8.4-like isoform X2 n=1 Tax=Bufo gargarizans TaxID=30331 RepID=UPI001CF39038|nr:oocyte zinc finger protein XlCOF8.4-like isoform X2 [Bufo gargarizans]